MNTSADNTISLDVSYGLAAEYVQVTFRTSDGENITVSNTVVHACFEPTREYTI